MAKSPFLKRLIRWMGIVVGALVLFIVLIFCAFMSLTREFRWPDSTSSLDSEFVGSFANNGVVDYRELDSLIELGADVDARFGTGNEKPLVSLGAGLHVAVCYNDTTLIKYLLARGANINIRDWWQETPLMRAVERDNIDAARVLIDAGADVNTVAVDGLDINSVFSRCQSEEMKALLIKSGAVMSGSTRLWQDIMILSKEIRGHKLVYPGQKSDLYGSGL